MRRCRAELEVLEDQLTNKAKVSVTMEREKLEEKQSKQNRPSKDIFVLVYHYGYQLQTL